MDSPSTATVATGTSAQDVIQNKAALTDYLEALRRVLVQGYLPARNALTALREKTQINSPVTEEKLNQLIAAKDFEERYVHERINGLLNPSPAAESALSKAAEDVIKAYKKAGIGDTYDRLVNCDLAIPGATSEGVEAAIFQRLETRLTSFIRELSENHGAAFYEGHHGSRLQDARVVISHLHRHLQTGECPPAYSSLIVLNGVADHALNSTLPLEPGQTREKLRALVEISQMNYAKTDRTQWITRTIHPDPNKGQAMS